ncbi:hypothetical protein AQUCO_00500555v1 [Aquilegia coerulea]|uniref:F-box domain-containing protein n=1 Tax=Aquilegia coerulea TaxID=218851 RepID=A0A2G5ESF7_AQUCA|nr:hypothetical protein AQUCO_00500555v1 [Aquilegia coerulea]
MEFQCTQMSTRKKLKSGDQQDASNGDRISDLPDNLLHQILASLDMKCVVQTSVLSTRWRNLWMSLPTLNFDLDTFLESTKGTAKDKDRFMEFVDQVFIHQDITNVQKFHLFYNEKRELLHKRVYSWICAAVRRNVQELFIDFPTANSFKLPFRLFTCQSLKVLKLEFGSSYVCLRLPEFISLPVLKTVHLKSVRFSDESRTSKFFSSCVVLESLAIIYCDFSFYLLENLIISCPKLKHLVIENDIDREDWYGKGYCKVKIFAPYLESLRCRDHLGRDYVIENSSSLVKVEIYMEKEKTEDLDCGELSDTTKEYGARVISVLSAVRNVRELTLSPWLLEVIFNPPVAQLESVSLQFLNLRHLKLKTWLCNESIHAITYLLNISLNVETLIVEVKKRDICIYDGYKDHFWTTGVSEYKDRGLPLHCMNHLKFFGIKGILGYGCINVMIFLEILLKKALVLEKMVVFTAKDPNKDKRLMKFREKLQQISPVSSNVGFFFESSDPQY